MAQSEPNLLRALMETASALRAVAPRQYDELHAALQAYRDHLCNDKFLGYTGNTKGLWALRGGAATLAQVVNTLSQESIRQLLAHNQQQPR